MKIMRTVPLLKGWALVLMSLGIGDILGNLNVTTVEG